MSDIFSRFRAALIKLLLPSSEKGRRSLAQCERMADLLPQEVLGDCMTEGKLPADESLFVDRVLAQLRIRPDGRSRFSEEEWLLYRGNLIRVSESSARSTYRVLLSASSTSSLPIHAREVGRIKDFRGHDHIMKTLEEDGFPPATVEANYFEVRSRPTNKEFEIVEVEDQDARILGLPPRTASGE